MLFTLNLREMMSVSFKRRGATLNSANSAISGGGGGPRPQKAPKSPFFKGPFGVLGGKKGTFGALIFFALFH